MKQFKRATLLTLSILAVVLLWHNFRATKSRPHPATPLPEVPVGATFRSPRPTSSPKVTTVKPTPSVPRAPAAGGEKAALLDMTGVLMRFTQTRSTVKDLMDYLEQSRQKPLATHDANPYTGEMAIVRTGRPLPGTRYFHAQYFNGEDGAPFVQHMSFEYQPSPTALDEAIVAVQHAFSVSNPDQRRADYAQWSLNNGYILWVKKMGADDLKDDPFNAYTAADVGTVRVAVEVEVH